MSQNMNKSIPFRGNVENANRVNPLVSIIVPIYNVERYLERCVDSLIEQTYQNIEIILVDDGSIDLSGKICDKYAGQFNRIKSYHKPNGGLSDARNYGIEYANGEYLFFVDSDDWLEIETISSMVEEAILNDSDIVCCGIKRVYDDNVWEPFTDKGCELYSQKEALENYLNGNKICTVAWNKLYKRRLFSELRFPKGKINEDEFTTYKAILASSKIVYIDDYFYCYYKRHDSIMALNTYKNLDIVDALGERIEFFIRNNYANFASNTLDQALSIIYKVFRSNSLNKDNIEIIEKFMDKINKKTLLCNSNFKSITKNILKLIYIKIELCLKRKI